MKSHRILSAALLAVATIATPAPPAQAVSVRTMIAPLGEAAVDNFGLSVSDAGDVNGDGFADVIVGAPGNDAAGSSAGRAYIYYGGPAADGVADVTLNGEAANDLFGVSVSGAGDVNGDGYADVIVGAYFNSAGGSFAGRAYVFFGGPAPDAVADLTLTGEAAGDNFGGSVSGAGDANGDGYADVIVGAGANDAGGTNAGRAYVYFGGPSPDAVADITLTGAVAGDFFGSSVSGAGDVNGDGYADVIVGAPLNDAGGSDAGRAYVYHGGPVVNAVADLVLTGEAAGDAFGVSVSDAGDVNGDGYADLIVGADSNDAGGNAAGRAYVFHGGPGADAAADLTLTGAAATDFYGFSVSAAGDLNGDGFDDVIVGAYSNDAGGTSAGRAYVYHGGPSADAVADLTLTGEYAGDNLGYAVSRAGDVTGDGLADLVVGAWRNDEAGNEAGKAYVFDAYRYVLTSPNGGETWPVGSTQTIAWLGRDLADLQLSTDGGATYVTLESFLGGETENTHRLLVPHTPSRFARIRLVPSDALLPGRDHSDSLFTIETSVALLTFTVRPREGGGAELAWATEPAVGPQGIAGYRLYRSAPGASEGDRGVAIGPSLITTNAYVDVSGAQGSAYRIAAVNGLGQELALGAGTLASSAPLAAWPLPYRGGDLTVSFGAAATFGGASASLELSIYDTAGRLVRRLANGAFAPGHHTLTWDGRDRSGLALRSGLYFIRLASENNSRHVKLIVAP